MMEIGPPELIIILVIVMLIFGPGRIARLGRELGASIRQFKEGLEKHSELEDTDKTTSKP
jgi:sec-independent protein translocase protein TatA